MAYTKAQREAKEKATKASNVTVEDKASVDIDAVKAELEAKIRQEYEEKLAQATAQKKTATKIPLDTSVGVICNVIGGMRYTDATGAIVQDWDDIGSINYMELSDLLRMRNSARRFFEANWLVLEDTEDYTAEQLYEFLHVANYYKNVVTPDTLDGIFKLSPSEIIRKVSAMTRDARDLIATRAKQLIDSQELDSKKKIDALEQVLHVTFDI